MSHAMPDILEAIRLWWPIISAICMVGLGGVLLYLRGLFPTKLDHDRLAVQVQDLKSTIANDERHHLASVNDVEKRLIRIESQVKHLPDEEQLKNLTQRVAAVETSIAVIDGKVARVDEKAEGIGRVVDKIDRSLEMLLEHQLGARR